MNKISIAIVIVAVAILAFWGGTVYRSKTSSLANQSQNELVKPKNRGGEKGGTVGGELVSKSDGSIVLKSGTSKDPKEITVNVNSDTTFTKIVDGYSSDLTTGNRIVAYGVIGADGRITAKSVEINQSTPKETTKAASKKTNK